MLDERDFLIMYLCVCFKIFGFCENVIVFIRGAGERVGKESGETEKGRGEKRVGKRERREGKDERGKEEERGGRE